MLQCFIIATSSSKFSLEFLAAKVTTEQDQFKIDNTTISRKLWKSFPRDLRKCLLWDTLQGSSGTFD